MLFSQESFSRMFHEGVLWQTPDLPLCWLSMSTER